MALGEVPGISFYGVSPLTLFGTADIHDLNGSFSGGASHHYRRLPLGRLKPSPKLQQHKWRYGAFSFPEWCKALII